MYNIWSQKYIYSLSYPGITDDDTEQKISISADSSVGIN